MKYNIIKYPNKILTTPCELVTTFDENLQILIQDMFETMHSNNGIGLASNQIGISKQIIVVDTRDNIQNKFYLINPKIISESDTIDFTEGCLSFPNIKIQKSRSKNLTIETYDFNGNKNIINTTGLTSIAIQHEIDHIKGKTFIDNLSELKKEIIIKKLNKGTKN